MKLSHLFILVVPLAAHAWTGHVFNNMKDCIAGCDAKCRQQGGVSDGCSGGGGVVGGGVSVK
ncbi:hypothetical protein CKAH01_11799 [Colletotrichum kahawae]|uniref:Uncharacterized protein n=1 Tax=Colletotrichum kahawae TaxID=34407 RepID=A0AAE0DDK0_COLKA|nr:hypothetical protein CKAH01_11799 [Colletotrichum kahawae]